MSASSRVYAKGASPSPHAEVDTVRRGVMHAALAHAHDEDGVGFTHWLNTLQVGRVPANRAYLPP